MRLSDLIEGLQIIKRYEKDEFCVRFEHDEAWFSSSELEMDIEDAKRLVDMGWERDEDHDGWHCYA